MPLNEKKLISPRYVWCIFTYSLSGCLMMLALLLARCMYIMTDANKLNQIFWAIRGSESTRFDEGFTIITMALAVICLAACAGELAAFCSFFAYELDERRNVRRYLRSLGYRKGAVIRYEQGYFLFDVLCSVIGAGLFTRIIWIYLERTKLVQVIQETEGIGSLLGFSIYGTAGVVMLVAVAVEVAVRVGMESYNAFASC